MDVIKSQKTVVVDVKKYRSFDGKIFDSEGACIDYEKRKRGERIDCPCCGGRGSYGGHTEKVLNEFTYQYEDVYTSTQCSKCKGKGYLDKITTWG